MTSQQSVNTKIIACFPSSLFFVIIKRDFITDLNVPAFLSPCSTVIYSDCTGLFVPVEVETRLLD